MLVERLSITDAAAKKLGPLGHDRLRIRALRQESPKLGMPPAQPVSTRVAMSTNSIAKASHLECKLVATERIEVFVHVPSIGLGEEIL